jgi:hypothetical protein
MTSHDIELTLENLQTIRLWHRLLFKDREETQKDIEVITKISALVISERDRDREFKKRLGKYRGIL